jgi:Putative transposase
MGLGAHPSSARPHHRAGRRHLAGRAALGFLRPGLFLPVRVLSRLFRRLFLEKLAAAHDAGRLQFFGDHAPLAESAVFAAYLAPLRKAEWVVYAKRPPELLSKGGGPEAVPAYLSRYTHRVAIANSRHLALDEARDL